MQPQMQVAREVLSRMADSPTLMGRTGTTTQTLWKREENLHPTRCWGFCTYSYSLAKLSGAGTGGLRDPTPLLQFAHSNTALGPGSELSNSQSYTHTEGRTGCPRTRLPSSLVCKRALLAHHTQSVYKHWELYRGARTAGSKGEMHIAEDAQHILPNAQHVLLKI